MPGGFVRVDEDASTHEAARRILKDKSGTEASHLEQLATFSGPFRDPRGWSISVAYYALVPADELAAALEEDDVRIWPVGALPALPFDHREIIDTAVARLRSKSSYSSLPAYLLKGMFTMAELQRVYEEIVGEQLDRTSFRRNILAQGVVESVEGAVRKGSHRPAQLYRRAGDTLRAFDRTL